MVQKVKIPTSKRITQFFTDFFTADNDIGSIPMLSYSRSNKFGDSHTKVLCAADVENTVYLAVKNADNSVSAVICPIHDIIESKPRSIFDTKHKWVSFDVFKESENPNYVDCPSEILQLLTPTSDENSMRWRNRMLQTNNNKPRLRS
jgi:hypothetical protein